MSKIIKFLNEVKTEFKNITWPKKETLIQLSIVVISISIIVSIILAGSDYLFTQSFALLSQPTTSKNNTNLPLISPTLAPTPTVSSISPSPTIKK
ncbi:preprotein translocase subunit SecE [Candidatus Shapirobacteria bacterium]|nr:MAG: preprotein translocase subunit SecE [Candidatus Shapirobacteria bacterium]